MIRIEYAALILLAAVLPLLEAPKNLAWVLYVVLWFANRARQRDFGGPWDCWDTVIALWIGSAYAAIALGGLGAEWRAGTDSLRYLSVLWLMKRSRYPDRVQAAVLLALVAGTLAALAWGHYGFYVTRERDTLGLKSVGHVNHSAIYLAIAFGTALMATRAWWRAATLAWRIGGVFCTATFALSLFVMQSRAAVGAAILVAAFLLVAYAVRRGRSLRPLALSAAALVALGLAVRPEVLLEKNFLQIERSGTLLAFREAIWRTGLYAYPEFPLFGAGTHAWSNISEQRVQGWAAARDESVDTSRMMFSSHGHNLYLNTLVERGAIGLAALLGGLTLWGVAIFGRWPRSGAPPLDWAYWGGATSAWIIAVVVGLVNTTLHHEHALLSMLLLGGWLARHHPHVPEADRDRGTLEARQHSR